MSKASPTRRRSRPKREKANPQANEQASTSEAAALASETAEPDGSPLFEILSGTRIDTGGWLLRRSVRVRLFADRLLLSASGRRPYHEAVVREDLGETLYSPYRGAVILAPAHHVRVRVLRMSPLDAHAFLDILFKESVHA